METISTPNYLTDLLLQYKETIAELKNDKIVLQQIIHNFLPNQKENDIHSVNDNSDVSNEIKNVTLSDELNFLFSIADEFNYSYPKKKLTFPSIDYFKKKGISRYIIQKNNGLKALRYKYIESRK
jgi:alpha-acetolactate decarboxylase